MLKYHMIADKEFYYKRNRLVQLKGFCAVVQNNCCVSEAARKLNGDQTTFSKQIMALERDLGLELFDRSKHKKLVLNEIGKLFYEEAIKYVNGLDGLFYNFNMFVKEYRDNNLRIASIDIIIEKILPYVAKLKEKYPDIKISLYVTSKDIACEKLKNKELDIAFFLDDVNDDLPKELDKEKISDYTSYWTMWKEHPLANKKEEEITKEDISKYPFGLLRELIFTKSYKNFVEDCKLESPVYIENGTINILKQMVRSKMCLVVLNDVYLNDLDKKDFILKSTLNCMPKRFYYCFFRKNTNRTKIVDEFYNLVKENEMKIFH